MDISRALKNNRLMKALTGLSIKEFQELLSTFNRIVEEDSQNKPNRKRKAGGGRKGALKTIERRFFFILFYLKVYPTFDLAGFIFGADRSKACKWVQKYLPLLEKTLKRECVLPVRKINSVEEFYNKFPGVKEIIIDGTERPIQRPGNAKKQRRTYSGKKKRHTRKNTIVSAGRRVLVVSPTKNGKIHDKKQLEKEPLPENIPPDVSILLDKAYEGSDKRLKNNNQVFKPTKKPKNRELTEEEKEENKLISSLRMPVEHAIGGIKRYNSTSHPFRNKNGLDDQIIVTCAGLWNYHLKVA